MSSSKSTSLDKSHVDATLFAGDDLMLLTGGAGAGMTNGCEYTSRCSLVTACTWVYCSSGSTTPVVSYEAERLSSRMNPDPDPSSTMTWRTASLRRIHSSTLPVSRTVSPTRMSGLV